MPPLFSALNEACPLRLDGVVLEDPLGWILRGTAQEEGRERPVLVRRFSRAILDAGLASGRLPMGATGGVRVRFDEEGQPCLLWAQVPGQTLAARAGDGGSPLSPAEAAAILQGAGHRLLALHEAGGRHGSLSPHSLWLGADASVRIIDLPLGPVLAGLAPRCPTLAAELAPFQCPTVRTPWQTDCFALGAMLYWAMAGKDLPGRRGRGAAIVRLASDLETPVPLLLRLVLGRLLGTLDPFPDPQALEASLAALERADAPEVQAGARLAAAAPAVAEPAPEAEAPLPRKGLARPLLLGGAAGLLVLAGWAADSCRGPRGPAALDALAAQESRVPAKAPVRPGTSGQGSADPKLPPRPQSPAVPPPMAIRPGNGQPTTKQPEAPPQAPGKTEPPDSRPSEPIPTDRTQAPSLAPTPQA